MKPASLLRRVFRGCLHGGYVGWLGLGLPTGSVAAEPIAAAPRSASSGVQAAWQRTKAHVAGLGDAAGWQAYLESPALEAALNSWESKAPTDDELALADRLAARLKRPLAELEHAAFAELRPALIAAAAAGLKEGEAAARLRKAAERYRDPAKEVAAAKARLVAEVAELQAILAPMPVGKAWFEQLHLKELAEELAADKPDTELLREIELAFSDGTIGLEWHRFLEVRGLLSRYRALQESANDGPDAFRKRLTTLADLLAKPAGTLTADERQTLNEVYTKLERSEQVPSLTAGLRGLHAEPNVQVRLSEGFLKGIVEQPVDETGPIREVILGTRIVAEGRTLGRVGFDLVPSDGRWSADVTIAGTNYSRGHGYNGPVIVANTGTTQLRGTKRIHFDGRSLTSEPGTAWAHADSQLNSLWSTTKFAKKLIEKIAWKQALKQKPLAERIAAGKAERKFLAQLEERFREGERKADEEFDKRLRLPLLRVDLPEPEMVLTGTDAAWSAAVAVRRTDQISTRDPLPEAAGESPLTIRLHDTLIHNLTAQLAGRKIDDSTARKDLEKYLPQRPAADEDEDPAPGSIVFAPERPVSVRFDGDRIGITMRTVGFTRGEPGTREFKEYDEALTITARYKVVQTDHGLRLEREDKIVVLPTGFVPGEGKLSLGQTVVVNLMEKLVGKFLKPQIEPGGIDLKNAEQKPLGKLLVERYRNVGGWIEIGMKLVPPANGEAAATAGTE